MRYKYKHTAYSYIESQIKRSVKFKSYAELRFNVLSWSSMYQNLSNPIDNIYIEIKDGTHLTCCMLKHNTILKRIIFSHEVTENNIRYIIGKIHKILVKELKTSLFLLIPGRLFIMGNKYTLNMICRYLWCNALIINTIKDDLLINSNWLNIINLLCLEEFKQIHGIQDALFEDYYQLILDNINNINNTFY